MKRNLLFFGIFSIVLIILMFIMGVYFPHSIIGFKNIGIIFIVVFVFILIITFLIHVGCEKVISNYKNNKFTRVILWSNIMKWLVIDKTSELNESVIFYKAVSYLCLGDVKEFHECICTVNRNQNEQAKLYWICFSHCLTEQYDLLREEFSSLKDKYPDNSNFLVLDKLIVGILEYSKENYETAKTAFADISDIRNIKLKEIFDKYSRLLEMPK